MSDTEVIPVAPVALKIVVCAVGILGNLVAIFIILILKDHQKSVTHWYVLQLAVADTIFLLTLPFRLSETLNGSSWIHPEWLCKATETILFLNYYSSTFFLMVMSVDRYIAVCHTFSKKLQKLRKRCSALIITAVIWTISLLICIPVIKASFVIGRGPKCVCQFDFSVFQSNQEHCQREDEQCGNSALPLCENSNNSAGSGTLYESGEYPGDYYELVITPAPLLPSITYQPGTVEGDCHYYDHGVGFHSYLYINFAALYIAPLLVMFLCYGLIIHRLSQTQMLPSTPRSFGGSSKRRKSSTSCSDKVRKRVTIMCATLVSSFLFCWMPYHAVHLSKIAGIEETTPRLCAVLSDLGSILAYLNSALNPYLYSFLGTDFVRRWRSAGEAVKNSVRRKHSTSGCLNARKFSRMKRERQNNAVNGRTLMTKVSKSSQSYYANDGNISRKSSLPDANQA